MEDERGQGDGKQPGPEYLPELLEAFRSNDDERVLGKLAWSTGRMGGLKSKKALDDILPGCEGPVRKEIEFALASSNSNSRGKYDSISLSNS